MPTYEYACQNCGGFDAFRSMAERNVPAACPECGVPSERTFASAPRLGLLEGGTRRAMDVNERAKHEPRSSRDYQRLKHPAGCGCCSSGRSKATVTAPNGAKTFPSKRPWMISH